VGRRRPETRLNELAAHRGFSLSVDANVGSIYQQLRLVRWILNSTTDGRLPWKPRQSQIRFPPNQPPPSWLTVRPQTRFTHRAHRHRRRIGNCTRVSTQKHTAARTCIAGSSTLGLSTATSTASKAALCGYSFRMWLTTVCRSSCPHRSRALISCGHANPSRRNTPCVASP